ncbi:MAG TPA: PrgI family protein, partial [Candidatus Saccharimonadales bacterium]|nr:PrgI family protein [Candidatus Saccharimonadales bacterium]
MATYKVIQDIEAEDKLVGPLSLRQFIYAGICIVCLYLSFICLTKGLAPAIVLFIPPAALFGFLAFPWSGEQPTEVWALAKVNFLVKPRKRIWNQSGVKELVTVTAPKTVETTYTNGLSQSEVKSRLKALADTIDSRGWVIKNVNGPMYGQMANQQNSQRLVGIAPAMPAVEQFTENPSEDVFDAKNNPVAQKFDTMIAASEKAHRQELMDRMNAPDMPAAPAPVQAVPVAAPQAPA